MVPTLALVAGLLFGSLLVVFSPMHAMLALVSVALFATILRRPITGLELFAFVATLLPFSTIRVGIRMTVSEALLVLTWVGVSWRLFTEEKRLTLGPTERSVVTFAAFSVVPFIAGEFMVHVTGNGLAHWLRWLLNLSTVLLVPLLLETRKQRERVTWLMLTGTGIMLVFSIGLFLRYRNALTIVPYLEKARYAHPHALRDMFSGVGNDTRLASPWIDPNNTGGVLAMFVPLAMMFAFSREGAAKILAQLVIILVLAGIMLSGSRGAMVSVTLILLWLAYWKVPRVGRLLATGAVIGIVAVLFYTPLRTRVQTIFSLNSPSTVVRLAEYRNFPRAVADYPLGIGFKVSPPIPHTRLLGISNLWLDYMYKLGLIGMLLFIRVTSRWWREVKPKSGQPVILRENALWIGATAASLTALITGVFDHYYSFTMVLIGLFWMIMGISVAEARALSGPESTLPLISYGRRT
ncbi:MAG: O-antigen ligase family protein [Acidiferrobacteraceae bacterium]